MRRKQTVEAELKRVNSLLFRLQERRRQLLNHPWIWRKNIKKIDYEIHGLDRESFALAWALSKIGRYESRPNPHTCG